MGWSWEGLDAYYPFAGDREMTSRIGALADAFEVKGLLEEAARYRACVEPPG
ncbi:MAG: hypothetical protein KJO11_15995 [Gemmatimonadetes bacterium]|nr:hypothetical protein [Gemmatimonadota bacterium]NNF37335.1 hypothetical protein [Gemmatimonadota bacterium]NNK64108.1 hypothetical protein [Gemmatimonadota bacterium]